MYRFLAALVFCILSSVGLFTQTIALDPLSVSSLKILIYHDLALIGSATGFVVQKGQNYYLITNRHVVLSCADDKDPNDVGGWICATKFVVLQNQAGHLGQWVQVEEKLFDDKGKKLWIEHPTLGSATDVIALPLKNTSGVMFYPLDLELRKADLGLAPGESVSVVGFPLGLSQQAGLAIWKTGTIASDLDVSLNGKPMFLLDTTSRAGMSGSPVFAIRSGSYRDAKGNMNFGAGKLTKFLGVYSSQSQEAEIGTVWKAEVVATLYDSLP
jgi:hypothetical protein